MHVRIITNVDVDVAAWRAEYGLEDATPAEVRRDIQAWCRATLIAQLQGIGMVPEGHPLNWQTNTDTTE